MMMMSVSLTDVLFALRRILPNSSYSCICLNPRHEDKTLSVCVMSNSHCERTESIYVLSDFLLITEENFNARFL